MFETIAVLGLGKIGLLTARMLHDVSLQVLSYDRLPVGEELPFEFQIADVSSQAELDRICGSCEAVLSCLPYQLNLQIAAAAHRAGIHYFDLTEDVATTNAVIEMAKTANGVMVPQCGLAPGFVGIVAASLIESFESCRACRMRVGALPQNPTGLMGYAFNWSPEGVVNEYLNDCEVIEDGIRKLVSPMEMVRDALHRRHQIRGVHHLRRHRHDVRDLSRQDCQHRLQIDPLSWAHAAHELLFSRAADAREPRRSRKNFWSMPSRPSISTWCTCISRRKASATLNCAERNSSALTGRAACLATSAERLHGRRRRRSSRSST